MTVRQTVCNVEKSNSTREEKTRGRPKKTQVTMQGHFSPPMIASESRARRKRSAGAVRLEGKSEEKLAPPPRRMKQRSGDAGFLTKVDKRIHPKR